MPNPDFRSFLFRISGGRASTGKMVRCLLQPCLEMFDTRKQAAHIVPSNAAGAAI